MNDDELKQLWKDQPMNAYSMSTDDLQTGAKRARRSIVLRNAVEYAACVLVIATFSYYLWIFPFTLMRIGSALAIVGTLVVAWQLHRRGSSGPLPADAGRQSWLDFQCAQLVRQRDALRSFWLWYVGPLLPSVVVFRWGVETELNTSRQFAHGWTVNLLIALVFIAVVGLNRWGARKLQQRIDKLDRDAR